MSKKNSLDVLDELDGGIFMQKVQAALTEVARAAITCGKQSQVVIDLKFNQIDSSSQVSITHKLATVVPRMAGKTSEEDTKKTPVYVHTDGGLSIFNENQGGFEFNPNVEKK